MSGPTVPVLIFFGCIVVILVIVAGALVRAGAGGMIPFIPVAVAAILMWVGWYLNRRSYRKVDLDQELRDLIERSKSE